MDTQLCSIYKSPRHGEMYLYVDKSQGISQVPEALLTRFGQPVHVMDYLFHANSKPLARADKAEVQAQIKAQGFYLQMPPAKDDYILDHTPMRPLS